MVYNVIGTMSGSSIDGLDIVYCTLQEIGGKWSYQINVSDCIEFPEVWQQKLKHITEATAKGISGLIFAKEPTISLPASLELLKDNIDEKSA